VLALTRVQSETLGLLLKQLDYDFTPATLLNIFHVVEPADDDTIDFNQVLAIYDFLGALQSLFDGVAGKGACPHSRPAPACDTRARKGARWTGRGC